MKTITIVLPAMAIAIIIDSLMAKYLLVDLDQTVGHGIFLTFY